MLDTWRVFFLLAVFGRDVLVMFVRDTLGLVFFVRFSIPFFFL